MLLVEGAKLAHDLRHQSKDFKRIYENLLDETSNGNPRVKKKLNENDAALKAAILEFMDKRGYEVVRPRNLVEKVLPIAKKILQESRE